MKMLMVIYRRSLDQDIRHLLKGLNVRAFTEAPKVLGMGEAGHAFDSLAWPGHNVMILSAMRNEEAEHVVAELKSFRDHLQGLQDGAKVPLRVFTLPCEQVI
ncbi:MAG: PG0541 family transporter-associated protein [Nitrospirota bacterium]